MKNILRIAIALWGTALGTAAFAQNYPAGLIDKTVAVVGNEMITISNIEEEIQYVRAQGAYSDSDQNLRCNILERNLESKLMIMQARIDSLNINHDYVLSLVNNDMDIFRRSLGGDEEVEAYFGKPMYKIRQERQQVYEDMSLAQQLQQNIQQTLPQLTPDAVKKYIATLDKEDLPEVPTKYQFSQICLYPDREAANLAVKENLLSLRERIINGEKFSTLARIYSEDPGSATRGGELGMTPKSRFWPAFSDASMALKPGAISQIVETPDGFHLIQVIEKKGDMFNARHILMKPKYTSEDREKAFNKLDSLRNELNNGALTFSLAAKFYSEDPATRTNGGQMADANSGSSYFEIDQIKPQDYRAIRNLKEGEISEPFESLDEEGNGHTIYKIIKVDKILPSHVASFENDYSTYLDAASNAAANKAIDEFIEERIKNTLIYIDPMFKDCDFQRASWKKVVDESSR